MWFKSSRSQTRITFRAPVIMMVLAATAIPVEFRPMHRWALSFGAYPYDVAANVAGYVPVGFVLAELGLLRAVITAALLTTFAENSQLVMMHRDPSAVDIGANVIGAIVGAVTALRCGIRSPSFTIDRSRALVSAGLALLVILASYVGWNGPLNTRGAASAGTLEAHWKLDEDRGPIASDSSGHGLLGRFDKEPARVAGVLGRAVVFDGATDHFDVHHSSALRLFGNMTLSAWVNSTSFPIGDAVIISDRNTYGYQLDTTVDRGPRTVGFKLTNTCGDLMMRYGATPLLAGDWYHVAGVYDAEAQTMNVYLNGRLDNGPLVGLVTRRQFTSPGHLSVGRRTDLDGYEFAGAIDDVRVYSLALTTPEITAIMHGHTINGPPEQPARKHVSDSDRNPGHDNAACAISSEPEQAEIPAAAAAFAILVTVACAGLWPSAGRLPWLAASAAAGVLFLLVTPPSLPAFNLVLIPLTGLAAGTSIVISMLPAARVRTNNPLFRMFQ